MDDRRIRRAVPLMLALALACGLLAVFLGRFEPARIALTRLGEPIAAALLVMLAALALGWLALLVAARALTRFGRLGSGSALPTDPLAAMLVGLPLYGTLIGGIAWTGSFVELTTILTTLLLGGVGVMVARRLTWAPPTLGPGGVLLLLPPVLLALIEATTPVVSPDELVYKLAVPRAYLLHGGMVDLPLNSHSYLVMAQGLASFGALVLSGGFAAKLVHFAVYLGALAAIRRLGDRVAPGSGTWAAAAFAWTPALAIIAGWCWSEWAILGLLALSWEAWERFNDDQSPDAAAIVILALGGAMAIKYTAVPWVLGFAVIALFGLRRHSARPASPLRLGATSVVLLALSAGSFYLRNLVWTGSPVAPFLLPDVPAIAHFGDTGGAGGIVHLLRGDDIVNPGLLDDALGVLLPVFVLLSPLALRGQPRRWPLFLLGATQLVLLVTLTPMSRLVVVAMLPLAVLGAGVITDAARASGRAMRWLLATVAGIVLCGQMILVGFVFVTGYDFMGYLVGRDDIATNLARTRAFAGAYQWIDQETPQESVILLIGENRTYHLSRRARSAGNLDGRRLARWLGRFPSEAELAREFSRVGVTHVLLHPAWIVGGVQPGKNLDPVAQTYMVEIPAAPWKTLNELLEHRCRTDYRDGQYVVYTCELQR